jgi:leucyl-tRNA synthetase
MRALSYNNSKLNITEPFNGLFTQGMVCHETYKDEENNWISPEEITSINGEKFLKKDNTKKIIVGPSESMSKSKKNTIDPELIMNNYGADSVRLFILSDSPPEKDVQWSEQGIESSYKFLQKLWTLHLKIMENISQNHLTDTDNELNKYTNHFIKKITNNLNNFSYNVIIANLHEMHSSLTKKIKNNYKTETLKENYLKILTVIVPVIPHFANQCIQEITSDFNRINWPSFDEKILFEEKINYVVQINGKKRGILNLNRDIDEEKVFQEIIKDKNISKYISDKKINKKIFIPNKLINIIV